MKKQLGIILAIIFVIVVGAALITPHVGRVAAPAHFAAAASDMRQCGLALSMYHEEHGTLPKQFSADLIVSISEPNLVLYLRETDTGRLYKWHYYGRLYQGQPLSEFIAFAAPLFFKDGTFSTQHEDGARLVGYADGSTKYMDEADFQAAIERQKAAAEPLTPPSSAHP